VAVEPQRKVPHLAVIRHELARGDAASPTKLSQNWNVRRPLAELAPEHLQDEWFSRYMKDPPVPDGSLPHRAEGASDRWLPYTCRRPNWTPGLSLVDGSWRIDGRKQVHSADWLRRRAGNVVYANTDPTKCSWRHEQLSRARANTPGLEVTRCNRDPSGGLHKQRGDRLRELPLPEDHHARPNDAS